MANIFKQMGKNTSPFILIAWPLGVLLVAVAVILMIEDYNTSRLGYMLIPTRKVDLAFVPFAVALVPLAGQIVCGFIYGRKTDRTWALLVMVLLFSVDFATDVYFKSLGVDKVFNWWLVPLAMLESLFIFTLGSEVMFTLMGGFVAETTHEFLTVFGQFLNMLLSSFESLIQNVTGSIGQKR